MKYFVVYFNDDKYEIYNEQEMKNVYNGVIMFIGSKKECKEYINNN